MTKTGRRERVARRWRPSTGPLANLRAAEAIRTVVECPHRLAELIGILVDGDLRLRSWAAAAIASLAVSHPERLLRHLALLSAAASDPLAHVRWNLAFALGKICARFPGQSKPIIPVLLAQLKDSHPVVSAMARYNLAEICRVGPHMVSRLVAAGEHLVPDWLSEILHRAGHGAAKHGPDRHEGR